MRVSQVGVDLIKKYEGCRLTAYKDLGGILTIGYGQTGPQVKEGLIWSQGEANMALIARLNTISRLIESCTPMMEQHQFDALCSLVYNIGITAFRGSTLLKCLNTRDLIGASQQILRWNKVKGVEIEGLKRRRQAEHDLFVNKPPTHDSAA